MATTIDPLRLRKVMGRNDWLPPDPWGPDGWMMDHYSRTGRIIVTVSPLDGVDYTHASMAWSGRVPTYDELVDMHRAVFNGYSYQVFAPPSEHVNIHRYALHLWGRTDGKPVLPEFTKVLGVKSI